MSQILQAPAADRRDLQTEQLHADLIVVGGGMSGTCCAITAARAGARVVLIQDRPVLGGNASSEVRLRIVGATAHGRSNNRWAREGGVLDEILVENTYRNPDGNAVIFDTVLLEKVVEEPNITLLLNTAVFAVRKDGERISSLQAFCSMNQTMYNVRAPLYCDSSGDGVLGYLSGAAYRVGAESSAEFGEGFAPTKEFGALLGHSLYFYSKDVGRPVRFVPPSYALDDITKIPTYRKFDTSMQGYQLWWIEYGGRLDTIHDTERIKWELWKIVYGVWNHLKNSGEFADADNLTLEWVGLIPGRRESRRFEGHYMLRQRDIVEQITYEDAVAFGGWPIDLHPADGVFGEHAGEGSGLLFTRGVYQIPYRCLISRNIRNLFLAGRVISASHVAFGSTRVMGTGAHTGQAVGIAAALCARYKLEPTELLAQDRMRTLQMELLKAGQHIPSLHLEDPADLARQAHVSASSELSIADLPADGPTVTLDRSRAQLLPVPAGELPQVTFTVDVAAPTTLRIEVRTGDRPDNHTPDVLLAACEVELPAGKNQPVKVDVDAEIGQACYVFFCLMENEHVAVRTSNRRVTGLLSVLHRNTQSNDEAIGRPRIEFWCPERRPAGRNLAVTIEPPVRPFSPENIRNGYGRPTSHPNAWVASPDDSSPTLILQWSEPKRIREVCWSFDTDHDHPMESVLGSHSECAIPFCIRNLRVRAGNEIVAECADNYQTRNTIFFDPPVETNHLSLEVLGSNGDTPAALFELRCYA